MKYLTETKRKSLEQIEKELVGIEKSQVFF